jgi:hypothetical protein
MATADLRPMTLGEVLDRTFKIYFANFWLFSGIMAFPFLILFVVNIGYAWINRGAAALYRTSDMSPSALGTLLVTAFGSFILLMFVAFIVSGIGEAATILAISDLYLGKQATIRETYRRVRGRIVHALLTIFLVAITIGAATVCFLIPGIFIGCRTAVAVPVAMLEDAGAGTAFGRSMELTKGFASQIFLIFILTASISFGISSLFTGPFVLMTLFPKPHELPFGMVIVQNAVGFIGQVLAAPIQTIAFSLMYYNLRVRKEGFDLEHLMGSLEPPAPPALPTTDAALPS